MKEITSFLVLHITGINVSTWFVLTRERSESNILLEHHLYACERTYMVSFDTWSLS